MRRAQAAEAADPTAELPFAVTILVLGLSGAGKSATINSLLGREASPVSATGPGTKKVSPLALFPSVLTFTAMRHQQLHSRGTLHLPWHALRNGMK